MTAKSIIWSMIQAHKSPEPVTSNKYYEFVYKHDVDVGAMPADTTGSLPLITHSFDGFRTAGADFNGDGQADGLAIIKKTIMILVIL